MVLTFSLLVFFTFQYRLYFIALELSDLIKHSVPSMLLSFWFWHVWRVPPPPFSLLFSAHPYNPFGNQHSISCRIIVYIFVWQHDTKQLGMCRRGVQMFSTANIRIVLLLVFHTWRKNSSKCEIQIQKEFD